CPDTGAPTLAEVTFPPSIALEQAKLFLFRELEELPVPGGLARWEEAGGQVRIVWSEAPAAQKVELIPGVWEQFSNRTPGETIAIAFDLAAGWDRARAEQWIQRHTRRIDTGRAVALHRWHRPTAALAGVLARLGLAENAFSDHHDDHKIPAAEFIPVPRL